MPAAADNKSYQCTSVRRWSRLIGGCCPTSSGAALTNKQWCGEPLPIKSWENLCVHTVLKSRICFNNGCKHVKYRKKCAFVADAEGQMLNLTDYLSVLIESSYRNELKLINQMWKMINRNVKFTVMSVHVGLTCLWSVKVWSGGTSAERLRQWWLCTWSWVSRRRSSPCGRGRTRWTCTVRCGWARRWEWDCTPPLSLWRPCGGSWGWRRTGASAGSERGQNVS